LKLGNLETLWFKDTKVLSDIEGFPEIPCLEADKVKDFGAAADSM
jgi:hypothetical protein